MSATIPPSPDAKRSWPDRFGLALDRFLNVLLFDGDDTWTISLHAAVAQEEGKRWGCWLCWLLDRLVQKQHCPLQLDSDAPTDTIAGIKAGALMLLVVGAIGYGIHFLIGLL